MGFGELRFAKPLAEVLRPAGRGQHADHVTYAALMILRISTL